MKQRIDCLDQFSKQKQISNVKRQLPKTKDFTDMDLSHLDLSGIESDFWENAIFHNTNFSNTGIRFCPIKLKNRSMINCNFENVDLSYLTDFDLSSVHINGCNFRNTNLNINLNRIYSVEIPELYRYNMYSFNDISMVKLDTLYSTKPEKFWTFKKFNMETLELNPFIKISPEKLLELIQLSIPTRDINLDDNDVQMWIEKCQNWIKKYNNDTTISELYEAVKNYGTILDCLRFFQGYIENINFSNITFKNVGRVWTFIQFRNCTFNNVTFENSISQLNSISADILIDETSFSNVTFTNLSLDSWKSRPSRLFGGSIFTFKRNLYLELWENCNCKCSFCRNNSFSSNTCRNQYNIANIEKNLAKMAPFLDTIFIGGGEPTLRINAIKEIYHCFPLYYKKPELIVVSNGSMSIDSLYTIIDYADVYISRHAIRDEDNISILNPKNNTHILSLEGLRNFPAINKISFSPVCVKNGLDSSEKIIEYISKSIEIGIKNILISTLHKDASYGSDGLDYGDLYVSPKIFDLVKEYLILQGYIKKTQICSTGGYLLDIFKNEIYTITFKEYIDKADEQRLWFEKCKRTFDFSMTPNGDVFENWRQDKRIDLDSLFK